jgi:hypothetical protein
MVYTAVTALPYDDRERATTELQALIRSQLTANGASEPPDWLDLTVTGPLTAPDYYGREWYWYRGTLADPATPVDADS